MSDNTPFGFGSFVPGFDFLRNLSKGASSSMPGLSDLSGWVAPTMNVEDLDKRIQELKAVQFWLEQNARALTATVQALEVQKMTLSTLQGMNVAMGDMAGAFTGMRTPEAAPPAPGAAAAPPPGARKSGKQAAPEAPATPAALVDPMQWWNALTSQFQHIAASATQDAGVHQAAFEATRAMADGVMKSANDVASQMAAAAQPAAAKAKAKVKAKAKAKGASPAGSKKAATGKTAPRGRRA